MKKDIQEEVEARVVNGVEKRQTLVRDDCGKTTLRVINAMPICLLLFILLQLHRELRLRNLHDRDTGNYTCAVIKGYDGIAERYADTSEPLWTVFGAEGNEKRAKIILDSLDTPTMFPDNLSTLVIAEVKTIRLRVRTVPAPVSEFTVKPNTIIAVLIWAYPPKSLSFYQVRSFTAEFRRHPTGENDSEIWERLDPINISPNIVSNRRRLLLSTKAQGLLFYTFLETTGSVSPETQ